MPRYSLFSQVSSLAVAATLTASLLMARGAWPQTASASGGGPPKLQQRRMASLRLLREAEQLSRPFIPEERADLLMDLARAAGEVDRDQAESWSLELFRISTTVLTAGPYRRAMQKNALTTLAVFDPQKAADLYTSQDIPPRGADIPGEDVRTYGTRILFRQMWAKQHQGALPKIEEIAAYLGSTGQYPYYAMADIIVNLAQSDRDKAASLFSQAIYFLPRDPGFQTANREYVDFLLQTYKSIDSPGLVRQAVVTALTAINNPDLAKRYSKHFEVTTAKGTFQLNSEADLLVYQMLPLIRQLDPKWAEDLEEKHNLLKFLPQLDLDAKVTISATLSRQQHADPATVQATLNAHKLLQAAQLADQDPQAAVQLVRSTGDPELESIGLALAAGTEYSKDAAQAKSWLAEAEKQMDKMRPGLNKLKLLVAIAKSYFVAGDLRSAYKYVDRAFDLGEELFSEDVKANPGKMAYSAVGFDEFTNLIELVARYDPHAEGLIQRAHEIRNDILKARALGMIAKGMLESPAKT
ncbi:MAG TPA: hypothetical protein VI488_13510 [Candidatus Angelobacter sp.]